ncbi:hypothetical protein [Acinetobacter boissieri]|uniref:Lipoprotein n=1 Tax=Acinetobacter boissieri TaxID=1219383 RepID=A0A1G6GRM8_9GAMM|nr:hypothetical protein [Acinetobacter boissieri]SDB84624.1 hypothetical protein SAMN05421733_10284 [Acinetobacter boissieri]
MIKILPLIPFILALSACAVDGTATTGQTNTNQNTAQQLGVTALKIAINAKCTTELNNTAAWKVASQVMTTEQQQNAQNQVCGCVSDKAIENVNVVDLATAAFDPAARTSIATKAINNTVQACVAESLKR